ncbi:unnamed protein product [Rhizophagus irregularis]|nr:unnamed protein product [Rhizophagus irregularis]
MHRFWLGKRPVNTTSYSLTLKSSTTISPSSTKAEGYTVLTAIMTCPENSTVSIYTDLQNVISTYYNTSNQLLSERRYLKINNYTLNVT